MTLTDGAVTVGSMLVAVHQPNFFPWLGYFAKIARADRFVFLDDAQLPKKGGSWVNRVQVALRGRARWATAAVDRRSSGVQSISEARFSATCWRDDLLSLLYEAYREAPFRSDAMTLLGPLIENPQERIADYNIHAVTKIADALDLDTSGFVRSSVLDIESRSTERLISIVEALNGSGYLSGDGAAGYQEDDLFYRRGIELSKLDFEHPRYSQPDGPSDFLPGLSVIDALMNIGVSGTGNLLKQRAIVS